MNTDALFLAGINGLYLLSFVLFVLHFFHGGEDWKPWANRFLGLGFLASMAFEAVQVIASGSLLPITALYQALFFFSWCMVLVYLLMSWKLQLDTFGIILLPLILAMSGTSLVCLKQPPAPTYSHNQWFLVHILTAFLAYASFALSFVGALLYLVQNRGLKSKKINTFYHKLPSLESLESVVYRTMVFGFPLLTLALASGFFWTKDVYGVFWRWDPKFVASTLTWLIYLGILYSRYVSLVRGRKAVMASVFAFFCAMLTFLGVNFFESNVHSFLK